MLQPKRTKFRKVQKGRNTGLAHRGSTVSFGTIALKSVERGQMTARQIEAARRTISRRIKRGGKIFIRVFPDKPITSKPLEVRMGKGKGSVEYWFAKSNQVKSCTKLMVLTKSWLAKRLRLQQLSFRLKPIS